MFPFSSELMEICQTREKEFQEINDQSDILENRSTSVEKLPQKDFCLSNSSS